MNDDGLKDSDCKAMGKFIVGKMIDPEKSEGGLYIPDEAKTKKSINSMIVTSVGGDVGVELKPGDEIFVRRATTIPNTHLLNWIQEEDVIGIKID